MRSILDMLFTCGFRSLSIVNSATATVRITHVINRTLEQKPSTTFTVQNQKSHMLNGLKVLIILLETNSSVDFLLKAFQ